MAKEICPIWLKEVVHPRISVGLDCVPIRIEIIVRGALCGHILREYTKGNRVVCGNLLPENLKPYQIFEQPIITPSTKAELGHDIDISPKDIIANKLVSSEMYEKIESYALTIFKQGQDYAFSRGLFLADTKYEFGLHNGEIILIDEIHTPDSSRYFYNHSYQENVENNRVPKQLSKEFIREWLMEKNFMGRENDKMPLISNFDVENFQNRYLELYNILFDEPLKTDVDDNQDIWKQSIENYLATCL
jgi:phosphoribosylaminoimidazole-succinocarboxamide synthase